MKLSRLALLVVLTFAWNAPAFADDVRLEIRNGRVWLSATDATARQILTTWARAGETRIVNAEQTRSDRLTLRLEGVSEADALDIVLRSAGGLAEATALLDKLAGNAAEQVDQDSWEATNLLTISAALADAAALREETRGSHWRDDFPDRDDERFAGHFDLVMRDGEMDLVFAPSPATDSW